MVLQDRGEDNARYDDVISEYIKNGPPCKETNNNEPYKVTPEKHKSSNRRAVFAQCFVAGAGLIILTGCGMPIGYSAILLPQLNRTDSSIKIDTEEGSWIASVHSLAVPTAGIVSGLVVDGIGRRGCLQLATIPLFIGWIVMKFSTTSSYIIVARIILGFAVGLIAVPSQTLTMETANAKLRGMLSGTNFTAYTVGIFWVYTLSVWLKWDIVALCCSVIPVISIIYMFFIPESPTWLVRQNKIEKAKRALLWLRGGDVDKVNEEVDMLVNRAKADSGHKEDNAGFFERFSRNMKIVAHPEVLKPLFIICVYTLLQQLSGTYILVFYGVDIIDRIGGNQAGADSDTFASITAGVRCLASLVSCFLLYKIGRRPLGIISSGGTALACFLIAGYLFFKTDNSAVHVTIVTSGMIVYMIFNTIGLFSLPTMMLVELLPTRARAVLGGVIYAVFNVLLFGVTKAFPDIVQTLGVVGMFASFGLSATLLIIFIFFFVPETKNHTLEEIEDYFKQPNLLWVTRTKTKNPA